MKEIQGAVTEHWMVKKLRQHKNINDPTNVPRMSAEVMVKLNDLRNSMLGTKYTVKEWIDQLERKDPDYRDNRKSFKKRAKFAPRTR